MDERTTIANLEYRLADAEAALQRANEGTAAAVEPAKVRLNAFLVRFQEIARGSLAPSAVAAAACRLVTEELGVDRAYWSEVDWTTREFVIGADYTASDVEPIRGRFPLDSWEPFSSHHLDGRPVVVNDTNTDPRITPALLKGYETLGIRADLAVPVLAGSKLRSVLAVNQGSPRVWSADEVTLVWRAADWCWAAIERARAEAALRDSEDRKAFLLSLSDAVRPLTGAADIQAETTRLLREQLNAGWCYYVDWDPERKIGLVLRDSAREGLPSLAGAHDVSDAPEFLQLLADGTVRTVRDYAGYEQLPAFIRQNFVGLGFRSMMMAPLVKGDRLIASLLVGDTDIRDWSASEVLLLVEVAERTWAAHKRARAEAALRESEQALAVDLVNAERLRSLSERLVTEENFQAIYDEILSTTVAITRADAGTVQIYDPATKSLELIASLNFSRTITDYFHRVDASSRTACGIALQTGERAFVEFPDEIADLGCQLLTGEGIQSAVAYPLVSRTGTPLGMLNAHWRQAGHSPNDGELRFLDLLARQAADLIDRRQGERALRESEERLRQFGQASQDVLWIRDAETLQWIYLTQAFEETYGLDREAALTGDNMTGWLELIMPDDRQAVLDSLQQVRAGERASIEYRIRRPDDGELRWIRDTDFPMRDGTGRVRWIGGVGRDITEEKTAAQRQEVLVNELQHRARNLLGVVTAVADRTVKQGGSVQCFEERLQALSRAQGLLSKGGSDTVEVGELVRAELAAYANGASDRVVISGPKVLLSARQVQNFALAVHELTTNAVKYGALKGEAGRLAATWEIFVDRRERRQLALNWIESGIAIAPEKVTRRGYGTELIQEALAYALEAQVDFVLGEDGARCRIEMPIT